jgi:hypothetical protein
MVLFPFLSFPFLSFLRITKMKTVTGMTLKGARPLYQVPSMLIRQDAFRRLSARVPTPVDDAHIIVKDDPENSTGEKGDKGEEDGDMAKGFLDVRWADVQAGVFRQGLHFDKTGNGDGSAVISFQNVTTSFKSSSLSSSLSSSTSTSTSLPQVAMPFKSLRELRMRMEQQKEIPVHRRHFLEHQHGSGTLGQREKATRVVKASKAVQSASNYQKTDDEILSDFRRPKTVGEITNLVDERIRASRAVGAFDNLPGRGKPLDLERPSHVDPTEYLMNRIILKSGGTVAWAEKEREIRDSLKLFRNLLRDSWVENGTRLDERWNSALKAHSESLADINKLIRNYNLVTPSMALQKCLFSLDREIERLMLEIPPGSRPFSSLQEDSHSHSRSHSHSNSLKKGNRKRSLFSPLLSIASKLLSPWLPSVQGKRH